jgi:hypothetical protein
MKKIKEGNFIWDTDGQLEPLPLHYNEILMGFDKDYCKATASQEVSQPCKCCIAAIRNRALYKPSSNVT